MKCWYVLRLRTILSHSRTSLQVRVRVVGLNPTDWKHAYTPLGGAGTIAGCDASGDVVAVGSAVTHVKVGDRVSGFK